MKTFTMFRRGDISETHDANQMNPPDEPQFQGVVFDDGSCVIRWMTASASTSVWASLDDMLLIHGHPEYGSELVWDEQDDLEAAWDAGKTVKIDRSQYKRKYYDTLVQGDFRKPIDKVTIDGKQWPS